MAIGAVVFHLDGRGDAGWSGCCARRGARWADEAHPRYANVASEWTGRDLAATPARELLAGAHQIVEAAASYYVSIQFVLAAANLSEAIFTNVYNRLIKRKSDPPALTFLLGFDSAPIRAEKSLYDLAMWARREDELAGYLARTSGKDIAAAYESPSAPIADRESWREFTARLAEHLKSVLVTPSMTWISPRASPPRPRRRCSKRSNTLLRDKAATPTSGRRRQRRRGSRPPNRCSRASAGCAGDCSSACSAGRNVRRRCARMRSPTSAWDGRCCAASCAKRDAGWLRRAQLRNATRCFG